MPFYEELYDTTQIFDAGKQILPHGIFSHFETSLSPASAPSPPNLSDITTSNVADSLQPLENFVPMISSTKSEETVQAVSLINGSINGNEQVYTYFSFMFIGSIHGWSRSRVTHISIGCSFKKRDRTPRPPSLLSFFCLSNLFKLA